MIRAATCLRIEKRILVGEIVEAAFWNYLENGQGLVTENTYRQFAPSYKLFYQQFAIVLRGTGNRRREFLRFFHDVDANSGPLSRRLDYHGWPNAWLLVGFNRFPLWSSYA